MYHHHTTLDKFCDYHLPSDGSAWSIVSYSRDRWDTLITQHFLSFWLLNPQELRRGQGLEQRFNKVITCFLKHQRLPLNNQLKTTLGWKVGGKKKLHGGSRDETEKLKGAGKKRCAYPRKRPPVFQPHLKPQHCPSETHICRWSPASWVLEKAYLWSCGGSSIVDHLASMCKDLGSISSPQMNKSHP